MYPPIMVRRPANLIYWVNERPPVLTTLLLGLQHIFILSISFIFPVVIVGEIGGTPQDAQTLICMAMIATGLTTMLQSVNKGPIGSGYLCPLVNGPAFIPASLLAGKAGGLALIFGMTAAGGIFEGLFSLVVAKLRRFFPPEVTGTIVLMVGIEVIPIAIPKFFGIDSTHPAASVHALAVAMITLAAIASFNVWGKGKMRLYSLLIGMAVGYVVSFASGLLSFDDIRILIDSPMIRVPEVGKFGVSFDYIFLVPFVVAALSSALKTMGDLAICQKINDASWKRMDMISVSKGIRACAIGNIASGLFGALGQSVSSSNIGLSIATGATSRYIGISAGIILIFMAFLPKLAAIFVIMPTPVMGASLVFAVSFMILAGIQVIMSRMIDARKTFVIGLSIIFGLAFEFVPGIYSSLHPWAGTIFSSSLSVATISAILLNMFFRLGVGKSAVLELVPGVDSSEKIFSFMEKQGGAWGARQDVMVGATAALAEFLELASLIGLEGQKILVKVQFDEFNLDIFASYRGEPFDLSLSMPRLDSLDGAEAAPMRMAAYMMKRYASKITFSSKDGQTEMHMHFEH
jgi:NCS2 family nucleobase:cation symporter-2